MVAALQPLRQLLVSPTMFFDERPPAETLPMAAGAVVLFTLALVVGIALTGSMLAGAIDATVTMDNPDRPPEQICERHADDPESVFGDDCDEPATIERDAGALVQEEMRQYIGFALVVPFVLWAVAGIVLFGTGRLVGGDPSFAGTVSLAGWAALPELFRLAVGLVGLWVALRDVTITDPDRAVEVLEAALAPVEPLLLVASLLTLGWQWYLLTGGMANESDIAWGEAAVAVGVPLGLFGLVSLL